MTSWPGGKGDVSAVTGPGDGVTVSLLASTGDERLNTSIAMTNVVMIVFVQMIRDILTRLHLYELLLPLRILKDSFQNNRYKNNRWIINGHNLPRMT